VGQEDIETGVTQMKWEPIDTAPKELHGLELLIYHPKNEEMFVCFWNGANWQFAQDDRGTKICLDGNETHWSYLLPAPDAA
jgi:hypothetical protein